MIKKKTELDNVIVWDAVHRQGRIAKSSGEETSMFVPSAEAEQKPKPKKKSVKKKSPKKPKPKKAPTKLK